MEQPSVALAIILVAAKAATLLVAPLLGTNLLWMGLRRLAPRDFFAVPVVHSLARWIGLGLGLVLIYAHQDARYHDLHAIFLPDSPWNITFGQFFAERVNPVNYGPGALVARAIGEEWLGWTVSLLALLFLVTVGYALRSWPRAWAARAVLSAAVIVVAVAYLTIYGVALLFWLLFTLNSWTFLVLAVVVHYYRRRV